MICWRVDSHRGPVPELDRAELAKNFIIYNCGSRSYIMLGSLGAETDVLRWLKMKKRVLNLSNKFMGMIPHNVTAPLI